MNFVLTLLGSVLFFCALIPWIQYLTKIRFSDDKALSDRRAYAYNKLCVVFVLLMGTQWLSMPIRSSAFQRWVNANDEAYAKTYSTFVMVPFILIYNIFAAVVNRPQQLIWVVCTFYGWYFFMIWLYLSYLDVHEEGHLLLADGVHSQHTHATSGGDQFRHFLMYTMYWLTETKSSITMSMIWSGVHVFFKSKGKGGQWAETVYPYLNFWCQIGATVGSMLGMFAKNLQIPIHSFAGATSHSLEHDHQKKAHEEMYHTHIVTGSTCLYYFVAFGTLIIPMFAKPAFDTLEELENSGEAGPTSWGGFPNVNGRNSREMRDATSTWFTQMPGMPGATRKRSNETQDGQGGNSNQQIPFGKQNSGISQEDEDEFNSLLGSSGNTNSFPPQNQQNPYLNMPQNQYQNQQQNPSPMRGFGSPSPPGVPDDIESKHHGFEQSPYGQQQQFQHVGGQGQGHVNNGHVGQNHASQNYGHASAAGHGHSHNGIQNPNFNQQQNNMMNQHQNPLYAGMSQQQIQQQQEFQAHYNQQVSQNQQYNQIQQQQSQSAGISMQMQQHSQGQNQNVHFNEQHNQTYDLSPAVQQNQQEPQKRVSINWNNKTWGQALSDVMTKATNGLRILLTKKYVFLVFVCSSGQLALKMILDVQGSLLASYVYHFPDDDGLNLKGPDPKHATDERTKLIASMLFVNGILAALMSYFGTGDLIKKYGLAKVLWMNPITVCTMTVIVCCASGFAFRHNYVTLDTVWISHGWIWNGYSHWPLQISRPYVEWNDYSRDITNDKTNMFGYSTHLHEVSRKHIYNLQGCRKGAYEATNVKDQIVALTWRDPATGKLDTFFDNQKMKRFRTLKERHYFEHKDLIEEITDDPDIGGKLTLNQCKARCVEAFPLCNLFSHHNEDVSYSEDRNADLETNNPITCWLYHMHDDISDGEDVDEAEFEKHVQNIPDIRGEKLFNSHSGTNFYQLKPQCSFQQMAFEAQQAGAAAAILVNPVNRRRVERIVSKAKKYPGLSILTTFLNERDFNRRIKPYAKPIMPEYDDIDGSLKNDSWESPGEIKLILHPGKHTGMSFYALFMLISICNIIGNVVIYAVNNPVTEVLWLQTSKTVKLQAKSWISAFGSNIMRSVGNLVNTSFNAPWFNPEVSLLFAGAWTVWWFSCVFEAGRLHTKYQSTGFIVDG